MNDLTLERNFDADVETVFAYLTKTENLLKWWGPEGVSVNDDTLNLSMSGTWSSTMVNAEGGRHKVSGEVLAIDPPNSVEFTWGWHDDQDQRGHESVVRFDVTPAKNGGSNFQLTHSGLPDEESIANHSSGWTSSLRKLDRIAT